jgi:hypothetical protein
LDDISVDGRILKCILKKKDGKTWTGLIWFKTGTRGALREIKIYGFLAFEDGTNKLSGNVGKELSILAA